jgi:hypothetical protein
MALALEVFFWLGSGFAVVRLGWPCWPVRAAVLLLQLSLSIGFGLGIFSLIFFLSLVFHFTHLLLIDGIVFALLFTICFLFQRSQAASSTFVREENLSKFPAWFRRFLIAAFIIAAGGALYSVITRMRADPHGDGWDAFAIWNLHARFLFRGGAYWRDGFTNAIHWSHPDYPLLLPASIARFWSVLGYESQLVPSLIAVAFTFATAGVLFSALSILCGPVFAMLGAIALLSTPAFIEQGASQYADVPLSFFMLATIVLLNFEGADRQSNLARNSRLLALAGLSAALAAWTKNEGLLFFGIVLLVQFARLIPNRSPGEISIGHPRCERPGCERPGEEWIVAAKQAATMLIAAAPVLVVLAYFKHSVAHTDEVFSGSASILHKLLEPRRYWIVARWYAKEFFRFGDWLWLPISLLMIALYFIVGREKLHTRQPGFRTSALALILTLAGCAGIYLVASYEIHWHLRYSLNRVFLQYWPSTIFLFFLSLRRGFSE